MTATYTIYGLRLRGDVETRYIGLTRITPEHRLSGHLGEAASQAWRDPSNFERWLIDNRSNIEAFAFCSVVSMPAARAKEREIVEFCLALNHRLFNRYLVPVSVKKLAQAS